MFDNGSALVGFLMDRSMSHSLEYVLERKFKIEKFSIETKKGPHFGGHRSMASPRVFNSELLVSWLDGKMD